MENVCHPKHFMAQLLSEKINVKISEEKMRRNDWLPAKEWRASWDSGDLWKDSQIQFL